MKKVNLWFPMIPVATAPCTRHDLVARYVRQRALDARPSSLNPWTLNPQPPQRILGTGAVSSSFWL